MIGISAPVFFLGPLALYVFWFKFTGYRARDISRSRQYGFVPWFSHWILPWTVLAVLYAAFYARMTRAT